MPQENKQDISLSAISKADSLLVAMTLEERVGQVLMPSIPSLQDEYTIDKLKKYIKDYHVGGLVLMNGDLSSAKKIAEIGEEAVVPLFIAIDAEWGLGMRLSDAAIYPKNGNLPDTVSETAMYDYGRKIAAECKNTGINMVLGPVIDLNSVKGGIIGKRSFGSDPEKVSQLGVSYAKGLESGGIISVAKHFPGHGASVNDSHKGVVRIQRSINLLDSTDLKPFRDYISSGLSGIMAGHLSVPALDPEGTPASVSLDILSSLLREEMRFKGLIFTDAFNMEGIKGFTSTDALKAGADIILCPVDVGKDYNTLLSEIEDGNLSLEIINDRCRRILFYKILMNPEKF